MITKEQALEALRLVKQYYDERQLHQVDSIAEDNYQTYIKYQMDTVSSLGYSLVVVMDGYLEEDWCVNEE